MPKETVSGITNQKGTIIVPPGKVAEVISLPETEIKEEEQEKPEPKPKPKQEETGLERKLKKWHKEKTLPSKKEEEQEKPVVLKKKQSYKERHFVHVSFSDHQEDLYLELKRIAEVEDRRISKQAIRFIKQGIDDYNRED